MKKLKKLPRFRSEDQEREFWAVHDATDYFDMSRAKRAVFPNLKPTTESISIRLPKYLLAQLKELASAKDVPYQSLMKMYLSQQIGRELGRHP
jgi:predicted DNA binding CopG/RHH family protein